MHCIFLRFWLLVAIMQVSLVISSAHAALITETWSGVIYNSNIQEYTNGSVYEFSVTYEIDENDPYTSNATFDLGEAFDVIEAFILSDQDNIFFPLGTEDSKGLVRYDYNSDLSLVYSFGSFLMFVNPPDPADPAILYSSYGWISALYQVVDEVTGELIPQTAGFGFTDLTVETSLPVSEPLSHNIFALACAFLVARRFQQKL